MSILIVDDEEQIVKTLSNHFALEDLPYMTASSAQEAVGLHQKHLFPVILTDICMPGMSGVEFVRNVKKTHPVCIVFVMTGYSTMPYLLDCLESGVCDYFTKPFDMDFVIRSVRDALVRYQRWKDILKSSVQAGL